MNTETLGIIGVGNIGQAIIRGVTSAKLIRGDSIIISDKSREKIEFVKKKYKVLGFQKNEEVVNASDNIIIAVKPQALKAVVEEIRSVVDSKKVIFSVCAGITTQYLERIFEKDIRVIRIMPNLPVTIGEGISGLCAGRYAKKGDLEFARKVFSSFGEVVEVEERLMDAVTGVSGSSPAYIALVIEALIEAGVKVGLSRDTSMKLILQTALGTCKLLKETGLHPAILRERVTSPGGTTASGVSVLEEHGVRGSFIKAVEEAVKRSGELAAIDEPK